MGRIYNKDKRLESHRWFPVIAWVLVFGFAAFVYSLSQSVAEKKTAIQANLIDEEAYLVPIDELRRQNQQ